MPARSPHTPRYAYVLAVLVGVCALPVILALAGVIASPERGSFVAFLAVLIAAHAGLGALFGLFWPQRTWRWGVWLCAGPACLVSFVTPVAWFFLGWVAVTLLPACLGSYAAARRHLSRAKVAGLG